MLKIHKKIVIFDSNQTAGTTPANQPWLSKLLAVPVLLVSAAVATVFLSAVFAVVIIPGSIIAYLAWRRFKQLSDSDISNTNEQTLTADYTVIKDPENK